jgi:NADH-quinone oxidoreductase subunit N
VILENAASLRYAIPEAALAVGVILVLAWDLVARERSRFAGNVAIALVALAVAAVGSAVELAPHPLYPLPTSLFGGQLACDPFACAFRAFFAVVTAYTLIAAIPTREAKVDEHGRGAAGGEFIALVLTVALGMNLMAMARTLLMTYLAIELVSIGSFVLAGFRLNDRRSSEAAMKYVVFGGVSSGVMLYGMSWIYGLTRSIVFGEVATRAVALTHEHAHVPHALMIAVACVTAGFAYKIAAAPFHMWAPDVYEGSPTLVAAFLSVGPKAAGFAVLVRFFREALVASSADAQSPWPILAGVLAVVTMTLGNLSAFGQTSLKRLLAYSSVAHAGTMLLAFAVFDDEGVAAIGFYIVAYCVMNLGAFLVVLAVCEGADDDAIDRMRGLGVRSPGLAAAMAVFLFSLVGLPPFAGFVGKLYVFAALLRAPVDHRSWCWALALAGAVNTVFSLFYYARILRVMYLERPDSDDRVVVNRLHAGLAGLLVAPTVLLGLWWGPLYDFVSRSVATVP